MPIQARTEFAAAINQIASEKGVEVEVVLDAIKQAALAAYRKDLSFRNESVPDDIDTLGVKVDSATGEISIWREEVNVTPPGFARIAAQTAKQVITQKLHEAEKGAIINEYEQKIGTVISGAIQRQEGNTYFVDLGRAEGLLPPPEQSRDEFYTQNQRLKFFIKEIRETSRGPEVIVSRTDPGLVKGLFAMEVPEIQSGAVEIKEIAREAGGRCKVGVISNQDGVDPVGSMVGQKGVRVQAVINELGEEKIDIISYSDEPKKFIASALSPAKDVEVSLDEENKVATVKVPDAQLSLAIGKGGQNVRLAAKLTGWKIDIIGLGDTPKEEVVEVTVHPSDGGKVAEATEVTKEAKKDEEVSEKAEKTLESETIKEVASESEDESTHDLTVGVSSLDRTSSDSEKPTTSQSGFYRDKPLVEASESEKVEEADTEGVAEESVFDDMEKEKIVKEQIETDSEAKDEESPVAIETGKSDSKEKNE